MTLRKFMTFSCHDLKFVSLSIGIELMLAVILEVELAIEQRIKQQNKTSSHKFYITL